MLKSIKTITIVGHFAVGKDLLNGQTVKTKILAKELKKQLGENEVDTIDTHGGKKALPKLFFQSVSALRRSKNVVILPAHNGIRFFVPVLHFFNRFYKRKLFYVVIGGWLPTFLKDKKKLEKQLKNFDGIFVETQTMKNALQDMGFANVSVMPNCKDLKILTEEELVYPQEEPYKLCTFSRVMKEKGIEDAVQAVRTVNEKFERVVYTLDIYGQVDENQTEWFERLQKDFPVYIRYGGLVEFDKSVDVLKNYFALLFPTRFYTEGIPGTIIDAYAAGLPVLASRWESYLDIIQDGQTGFGYDLNDLQGLIALLERFGKCPSECGNLKRNCLQQAYMYQPQETVNNFIERMEI